MKALLLRRPLALLLAAVTALAAALVAVDATSPASAAQAPTASRVIAHNGAGKMRSRIVGHTSDGHRVTGTFVPLRFVRRGGHLKVRGLVQGVVHKGGGTTTFTKMRTITVKRVNGRAARNLTAGRDLVAGPSAASARTCGILNLVLGPLDLNLLGLTVHLDRVVLNVNAVSGAGNLLGNLLCAVAGLLDGGLGGLLGQVQALLNQILGALNLGG
jgi:hypothetical protein